MGDTFGAAFVSGNFWASDFSLLISGGGENVGLLFCYRLYETSNIGVPQCHGISRRIMDAPSACDNTCKDEFTGTIVLTFLSCMGFPVQ
jgi:hypothetical protein